MTKFGTIYNSSKIYSDFEASEPEDVDLKHKSNVESHAKSNTKPNIRLRIILQVFRITYSRFNFNKICKHCIKTK